MALKGPGRLEPKPSQCPWQVHENEVKALKDEVTQKNWQLKQMKQACNCETWAGLTC